MLTTVDAAVAAPPMVGTSVDVVRRWRRWMATYATQDAPAATLHVIVIVTIVVLVVLVTTRDVVHDARDGGLLLGDQL